MRKLFKHLKPYAATIAAIVVILIVQAYCDLSLPSYTSDIVNVGIQQGGIDEKIPDAIAEEEMNKLLLFVAEEDQQTVLQKASCRYIRSEPSFSLPSEAESQPVAVPEPAVLYSYFSPPVPKETFTLYLLFLSHCEAQCARQAAPIGQTSSLNCAFG